MTLFRGTVQRIGSESIPVEGAYQNVGREWFGTLNGLDDRWIEEGGPYELTLEDGTKGEILIQGYTLSRDGETVTRSKSQFLGSGPSPR